MWYEIIPTGLIIVGVLSLPGYCMYALHKITLGNAYRRNTDERFERVMYQRDMRLTNNPYIMSGLDSIPDEKIEVKDENEVKDEYKCTCLD